MTLTEVWKPQEKQRLALQAPAFELFFGGARGGGKSDFLLADFTKGVQWGKDWKGILVRQSYAELEELLTRSYDLYPPIGGSYSKTTRTWTFPSGASLKMRFLESPTDVTNYQGHQYTWLAFDELTSWASDYEYTYMIGTVRSAKGVPCFVRASGNPGSRGHAWVKARFIDPAPPFDLFYDSEAGTSRVFIPSFLEDNPALTKNDPTYESRLRLMGERMFRAHRYGDWDSVEGGAFDEWRRDLHVEDPFPIPLSWYRFASLDWGYAKPYSAGLYAIAPDGWVVRYAEMYGGDSKKPNVGSKESAEIVAKRLSAFTAREGIEDLVCDPSMWQTHGHTKAGGDTTAIADEFRTRGFKLHKARNNRLEGKAKVHTFLQARRPDGKATFTVTSNCTNFLRTFPILPIDPHNPEDVDTEVEDHPYDEARYALNSRLVYRKPRDRQVRLREKDEERSEYDVLNW